ncbi:hypothetical protein CKA32_001497 [Geitlerinema sp. FC II]|nr:hypothetical protein CKA32_001497 [Geitlerinema sp. FC II]
MRPARATRAIASERDPVTASFLHRIVTLSFALECEMAR